MSTADREAIAAAASTVAGITVTPRMWQTTGPGTGMVRLDRRIRDDSGLNYFTNVWQVWVVLGQDVATAEQYLDDRLDDLLEALSTELVVTSATPLQLQIGSTTVPGVVIEGTRENQGDTP